MSPCIKLNNMELEIFKTQKGSYFVEHPEYGCIFTSEAAKAAIEAGERDGFVIYQITKSKKGKKLLAPFFTLGYQSRKAVGTIAVKEGVTVI